MQAVQSVSLNDTVISFRLENTVIDVPVMCFDSENAGLGSRRCIPVTIIIFAQRDGATELISQAIVAGITNAADMSSSQAE